MTGLPDALAGLEDAAAKLHREAYPDQYSETPPAEGNTVPAPPADAPPSAEPTAPPAGETPPETPPAAPAAGESVPAGFVPKAEYDALAHKFAVLQGKEYAEVPRMAAEIRALKDEIAALKARPAPPAGEAPAGEPPPAGDTVESRFARLVQEYGPEFVEDMRTVFREEARKEIEGVKAQVENVAAVTTRSVDEQYVATLSKAVPDWTTLVNDPGFAAYMNEEEGRTGIPRLTFAKEWQKRRDAERVAGYYLDYKQRAAGPPVASPAAPTPRPAVSKESLVAPTTTPQGAVPAGKDEVPYVRASELDKFARDVIAGAYRGREKEQLTLQARYDAAQAAGKIVPG
jgi:hypothetical protein